MPAVLYAGIDAFNEDKGILCPHKEIEMNNRRSGYGVAAAAVLAVAALGATGAAQAGGVFWSLGVDSPGLALGLSNAPPVYVAPQPVYVQPQPVYLQPQGYYVQPAPVYEQRRPVVVAPYPVYRAGWVRPGYYGDGWRGREQWRDHRGREDRHDHRGHEYDHRDDDE